MPVKRPLAVILAALLAFLCFACRKEPIKPGPGKPTAVLLTLYTDTQPLRIVTQEKGVTVTLQMLEYEPTVGFFRPISDEWQETLVPGKDYTVDKELADGIPEYRLLVQQGENIALHNLTSMGFEGSEVFELVGKPWAPAPIDEASPMIHLARTAAIVPQDDCDGDLYGYWYAIANAISTLRAVDLELYPDEAVLDDFWDEYHNWFRVPEWLFEAYALALYPAMDVPPLGDYDLWVQYHPETHERYWVGEEAYSDSARAEYKSARWNKDGTWDVTFTISYTYDDETQEKTIQLAPNAAWNPNSPFEYHIVGWPEFDYGDYEPPIPATPPPEYIVGTWRAPVKRGHAAWLEIYPDGMAGLCLGDSDSDQLYEIYRGTVSAGEECEYAVNVDMEFHLDWYIYETGDGTPVTGVPDAYSGSYGLSFVWEDDQQVLYVVVDTLADKNTDPLFDKSELKMLWTQKTLGGGRMVDAEASE